MMFLSAVDVTKPEYFLEYFLDIRQNSDMDFPIFHVYICLWLVDEDELLEIESTWIWIIHSMIFIVSQWLISGEEFLVTHSTEIQIVPSMTLHVSLFCVCTRR